MFKWLVGLSAQRFCCVSDHAPGVSPSLPPDPSAVPPGGGASGGEPSGAVRRLLRQVSGGPAAAARGDDVARGGGQRRADVCLRVGRRRHGAGGRR